nr:MAG TPA: hypothetical protein [Caudoviricetes sp.]
MVEKHMVKLDPSKSSLENFLKLIKDSNPNFDIKEIEVKAVEELEEGIQNYEKDDVNTTVINNTKVTFSVVAGKGYAGEVTVVYRRIHLGEQLNFYTKSVGNPSIAYLGIEESLLTTGDDEDIDELYFKHTCLGLGFIADALEYRFYRNGGGYLMQLIPKYENLIYTGGCLVNIKTYKAKKDLGSLIKNTQMLDLEYPLTLEIKQIILDEFEYG